MSFSCAWQFFINNSFIFNRLFIQSKGIIVIFYKIFATLYIFLYFLFNNINVDVFQCFVCNLISGNCFRCSDGNCNTWFHISCGIFAGFDFHNDGQNKQQILIHCKNHCYVKDSVSFI